MESAKPQFEIVVSGLSPEDARNLAAKFWNSEIRLQVNSDADQESLLVYHRQDPQQVDTETSNWWCKPKKGSTQRNSLKHCHGCGFLMLSYESKTANTKRLQYCGGDLVACPAELKLCYECAPFWKEGATCCLNRAFAGQEGGSGSVAYWTHDSDCPLLQRRCLDCGVRNSSAWDKHGYCSVCWQPRLRALGRDRRSINDEIYRSKTRWLPGNKKHKSATPQHWQQHSPNAGSRPHLRGDEQ